LTVPPPAVPDHDLVRPIGRGAYGEVWLARNVMGTPRAVKVIWRNQFGSSRPFEREFAGIQRFEPVSRSSGGLVHVLHVGRNDAAGYFYYVMELADDARQRSDEVMENRGDKGTARPQHSNPPPLQLSQTYAPRTLRSDLKRLGRLPTTDCLRVAIDVASGLAQLHRHGLIHRDVKPGNIIYVNGRAKLADIGLVSAEGEGRTFVGTEGYIPPEGPGTPASDIFALGIALYEASTGLSPDRFPDVPTEWFTDPAGEPALELHEIILKACEGQRERRYASAELMQADLALLQSGQSVRHTRALQRRYARLRMSALVSAALLLVTLGAALFANYGARLAAESRGTEAQLRLKAQRAQALAESAERDARRQLHAALYEEARALVLSKELGHRARALDAIRQASGSTNAAELRRVAFAALGLPDLRLEHEFTLPGPLTVASLDSKLERMAMDGGPQAITIRSIPGSETLATLPPSSTNEAYVVRWSADDRFLAVKRQYAGSGSRSDLEVWDVARGRLLFTARSDVAYDCFSFHPKQPRLMVGHAGGAVSVWDLPNGREQHPFSLPATPTALAYSPDGGRVAASYQRGSNWVVAFHDARSGTLLGATECLEPATDIVWHPRGEWVSITGQDATDWNRGVWLIAPGYGAPALLGRHKIKTAGVSFSPDGNYLMSCGWERELICWDLRTRQRAFTCADTGYRLFWSLDGVHCAMIPGGRLRLQLYAFEQPVCLELSGNCGVRLRQGAFSPDGRWLAVPDSQNLCVWDLTSNSPPALLAEKPLCPPFFSPDGSEMFAVAGPVGQEGLKAWRITGGSSPSAAPKLTSLLVAAQPGLTWAGLAGDELVLTGQEGVRLVARTNLAKGSARLWRTSAGPGALSPDGRWLALTHSYSPLVTVYRLPEMDEVAQLHTSQFVAGVWFSTTADELMVINRGGVERWETATWQRKWRESSSPISDSFVLYAPDGCGLWRVTSYRDTAYCDRRSLEAILPLPSNVIPLAVSADGRQLAVSVDDQRVQVWDLAELRKRFRELGIDWGSFSRD
jgi:WD40 repeat protein